MSRRADRVSQLLRREVSRVLQLQLRDPRLAALISITKVETSSDLRNARLFVSVMGTSSDKEAAILALTSATGFLRRELGRVLSMRYIPNLTFVLDQSMERAADVLQLMDELASERGPTTQANER